MKNEEFICHGYLTLSNLGGIEIMINPTGESIIYKWYGKISRRWQEIKYSTSGRAFFRVYNRRYYLDQFMRNF